MDSSITKATGTDTWWHDMQVGDVVVHTASYGQGDMSITWTSPGAGAIDISGSAWDAFFYSSRDSSWQLKLNGTVLAERGTVLGTFRTDAVAFFANDLVPGQSLTGLTVGAGDVVELLMVKTPSANAVIYPLAIGGFAIIPSIVGTWFVKAKKGRPAAGMKGGVFLAAGNGQFISVFIGEDAFVLGSVVLKDSPDILHEGDEVNIADEEKNLDRPVDQVKAHLDNFQALLNQNRLGPLPVSFVPTAFLHGFGPTGGHTVSLAEILGRRGIVYINTPFESMQNRAAVSHWVFGFDAGVITIDRGEDLMEWSDFGKTPVGQLQGPTCGMHWPNLLHTDPERNAETVDGWVRFSQPFNCAMGTLLAANSESFRTQLVHHVCTRLTLMATAFGSILR